jgi:putative transposase
MDERYLIACVSYIETNPLRARLAKKPEDWPWSSAAAHIKGENDRFVNVAPLLQMMTGDWGDFLFSARAEKDAELLRKHERTGRPLGGEKFIDCLEVTLGMSLKPQKPGRKPKESK